MTERELTKQDRVIFDVIDRFARKEINLAQCLAYLQDQGAPDWVIDAVEGIESAGQGRN